MACQVSFHFFEDRFFKNIYFNRDVDSDGDEIPALEPEDPTDYQYSLWFTVDINVQPPDAQASVDLAAPCLVRLIKSNICGRLEKSSSFFAIDFRALIR